MRPRRPVPSPASATAAGAVGLAAAVALARAAAGLPTALGAPESRLRAVATRAAEAGSTHAANGMFHNTVRHDAVSHDAVPHDPVSQDPVSQDPALHARVPDPIARRGSLLTLAALLRAMAARGPIGRPSRPVPLAADLPPPAAAALAVTWYGHSSVLFEVDGCRVLADPVWGERVSPSPTLGPRRLFPPPLPLSALPPLDAVVISHDHYDHLDLPSIRALMRQTAAPFVVPLGVGEHLRRWGVPAGRVVELDWGAATTVGDLTLTCTEARHFSGRTLQRNTTLWSSWALAGRTHRAFFGGDTGYTPAFADIGQAHGPFDLTVLPIGAYSDRWPAIHMTPEEAVRAHRDLTAGGSGALLVPVHWATFNLGFHGWAEPAQRLRAAADEADVRIAVPRPGGRVDGARPPAVTDWWTAVG